ncbi:MAG: ABC transporter ATP-binding protein [Desulfosalsimonas sp.]|uniref:ABC transporter ATP-binding protein n=1 Tax=Desulfosalsimonas sp. TaxID=3073848 RepID=UPI0039708798
MADTDVSKTGPGGNKATAPTGPLLEVSGLCKRFTDKNSSIEVLNDLSLSLDPGSTMAVVGESGVGKSTLLHVLGALEPPDQGRVYYQGADVFELSNSELAAFRNARIGFVFQFHYLLSGFTGMENVMMPGLIAGMQKKEIRDKAEAILVRVGLQDRLGHRVGDLSGGEQQRVALARALVLNPDILLADEPTGNLDRKNSAQVHEFLVELNREMGMAMIVVTHSAALAEMMQRRMQIVSGRLESIE